MVKKLKQMLCGKEKSMDTFLSDTPQEMTLKEQSLYAKQLLDNPLWEWVLEKIEKDALRQCVTSPARDVEGREYFWKYIKAIEQLKGKIKAYLWMLSLEKKKDEYENPTL